jgi:glutathione S-transferase
VRNLSSHESDLCDHRLRLRAATRRGRLCSVNIDARYTLYCAPNTYAMGVHALLEEIGAAYRVHWVTLFADDPDPGFAAASPHCRVPALDGPDGALFESGAIALYLAERHPASALAIPPDDPRRGRFLQWLHYLASTLQPEVMLQFHPEFYFADAERQAMLRRASMHRLDRVLQIIDAALDAGPWFFGDQLTVVDFCFAMQAVWPEIYPDTMRNYRNIDRMVTRFTARPSAAAVLQTHNEAWLKHHPGAAGMNLRPVPRDDRHLGLSSLRAALPGFTRTMYLLRSAMLTCVALSSFIFRFLMYLAILWSGTLIWAKKRRSVPVERRKV